MTQMLNLYRYDSKSWRRAIVSPCFFPDRAAAFNAPAKDIRSAIREPAKPTQATGKRSDREEAPFGFGLGRPESVV